MMTTHTLLLLAIIILPVVTGALLTLIIGLARAVPFTPDYEEWGE